MVLGPVNVVFVHVHYTVPSRDQPVKIVQYVHTLFICYALGINFAFYSRCSYYFKIFFFFFFFVSILLHMVYTPCPLAYVSKFGCIQIFNYMHVQS